MSSWVRVVWHAARVAERESPPWRRVWAGAAVDRATSGIGPADVKPIRVGDHYQAAAEPAGAAHLIDHKQPSGAAGADRPVVLREAGHGRTSHEIPVP